MTAILQTTPSLQTTLLTASRTTHCPQTNDMQGFPTVIANQIVIVTITTADIIVPDIMPITTNLGLTSSIKSASGTNVDSIGIAAEGIPNVTKARKYVTIAGMAIHAKRHVTAVSNIRIATAILEYAKVNVDHINLFMIKIY